MDENKVLQMLKESAEEVTVPENLEADRIEERLRNRRKSRRCSGFGNWDIMPHWRLSVCWLSAVCGHWGVWESEQRI